MVEKDIGFEWEGQVKRIQYDINNSGSMLKNKIVTKLDFILANRKHVWRKTIANLPCPLDPSKTVDEMMIIYKHKNRITLVPKKTFKVKRIRNSLSTKMRKCEQCGNMVEHGNYEFWYRENDDDFKEEFEKEGLGPWICLDCDHDNNWSGYWD